MLQYRYIILLLSCLLPSVASAFKPYVSPENPEAYLRWFEMGATFVFDDGAPKEITPDVAMATITESFRVWSDLQCANQAVPFEFQFAGVVSGRQIGFDPDAINNENLIKWVTKKSEWTTSSLGTIALTSLTFDTGNGEIVDADLELNNFDFGFSVSKALQSVDLKNTVVHETGHVLGLDHSTNQQASMYFSALPGEFYKRDLHQDDEEGYCFLYGPEAEPIPESASGDLDVVRSYDGCGCRLNNASVPVPLGPAGMILFALLWVLRKRCRPA